MASEIPGGGLRDDSASRRQAALFCAQLHIELDRVEKEFSALETTLARQLARVDLRTHAGVTERELTVIAADRDHVHKMLAALGHAYPCKLPGCAETG